MTSPFKFCRERARDPEQAVLLSSWAPLPGPPLFFYVKGPTSPQYPMQGVLSPGDVFPEPRHMSKPSQHTVGISTQWAFIESNLTLTHFRS